MKKLLIILAVGSFTFAEAQVRNTTNQRQDRKVTHVTRNYDARETVNYNNGNRNYNFAPDNNGYTITNEENGTISTVGKLRKTVSDDEYYIFHSNDGSRNSIGRFDNDGNFKAYRYDATTDRVVQDEYMKNMTERTRRTRTNRNVQENMNTADGVETPTDWEPNIKTPIND